MSYELCLRLLGQHNLQARVGRELKAPGRHVKRPSVLCSDPGPPPAPLFGLATEPDMAGLAFGHPWKNRLSLQLDWASLDGVSILPPATPLPKPHTGHDGTGQVRSTV